MTTNNPPRPTSSPARPESGDDLAAWSSTSSPSGSPLPLGRGTSGTTSQRSPGDEHTPPQTNPARPTTRTTWTRRIIPTHLLEAENTALCQARGQSTTVEVWGEFLAWREDDVDCPKCLHALAAGRG